MSDLFSQQKYTSYQPLAERMRPIKLKDFIGQKHILGKGTTLKMMIEQGEISSIIFWGPPGSGKTTLARIIAKHTKSEFKEFSAVSASINDVRKVIKEAEDRIKFYHKRTIIFIDEIHRFNKSQQDAFLPSVENGTIILIGATTENPSFEVNAPLISRSKVFVLQALDDKDIMLLIRRACKLYPKHIFQKDALSHIVASAGGDARIAYNALELAAYTGKNVTLRVAEQAVQKKAILYNKKGNYHYDVISAFIKSMRASDPNATLHWLGRMIKAGEDPIFIARRMVIFASEDIGNIQPTALVVATATMQAVHLVGMPEASIILAQTATYLATSKKSTASYDGLVAALKDIDTERLDPVPLHLRNAVTDLMRDLGYGKEHVRYPYKQKNTKNTLEYLPNNLRNKKYYLSPKKDN